MGLMRVKRLPELCKSYDILKQAPNLTGTVDYRTCLFYQNNQLKLTRLLCRIKKSRAPPRLFFLVFQLLISLQIKCCSSSHQQDDGHSGKFKEWLCHVLKSRYTALWILVTTWFSLHCAFKLFTLTFSPTHKHTSNLNTHEIQHYSLTQLRCVYLVLKQIQYVKVDVHPPNQEQEMCFIEEVSTRGIFIGFSKGDKLS